MIATGLDRLLAEVSQLGGRRYGVLAHAAAVTHGLRPIHLALAEAGHPPAALFAPEHGFYAVEQDMVPSADQRDPWSGVPVLSLYGDSAASLRPSPSAFAGLDLLLIDLQDVGARYYTFAATAVWAAEAALAAGCEVWVLDRPNPLGGVVVEGNLPEPGFESFVGAFRIPVRHGLHCELVRSASAARALARPAALLDQSGWRRDMLLLELERPWVAPSPNMPSFATAVVYPGMCLIEATELSEGRGTTRPFLLAGAPGVDAVALATRLSGRELPGVCFLPTLFKPQFQKHRGEICAGVELAVTEPGGVVGYRLGIAVLEAFLNVSPEAFAWRDDPYEFVSDRPAIDLLSGGPALRAALESRASSSTRDWIESWRADEIDFTVERRDALLYAEPA